MASFHTPWVAPRVLTNALGLAGACIAFVMFAVPAPLFRRFLRDGNTGLYSGLPYLATATNCGMWILYGCVTPGRLAPLATNAVGLAVESVYCVLFLRACQGAKRRLFGRQCCGALAALLCFSLATLLLVPKPRRTPVVGLVADIINVSMFASPLSLMLVVIRSWSVEGLSLPLSAVLLVCSSVWAAYGLALGDTSIAVPNTIGVALTMAQVALYFVVSCSGGKGVEAAKSAPLEAALLGEEDGGHSYEEEEDGGLSTSAVVDWVA